MRTSDIMMATLLSLLFTLCVVSAVATSMRTGATVRVVRHPVCTVMRTTPASPVAWLAHVPPRETDTVLFPGSLAVVGRAAVYADRVQVEGAIYPAGPLVWLGTDHFAMIVNRSVLCVFMPPSTHPTSSIEIARAMTIEQVDVDRLVVWSGQPDWFTPVDRGAATEVLVTYP